VGSCGSCGFKACKCCDAPFTVIDGGSIANTLIGSLTGCVDQIRDIKTCLGARAYTVSMIWTRWSGGERGIGVEDVIREEMILPTPKVSSLTALAVEQLSVGVEEIGVIRITEISPRYTEDELSGYIDGRAVPDDENFYYEVIYAQKVGDSRRRRYVMDTAPNYTPLQFQWEISLVKAFEDRTRAGDVRG